MSITSRIRRFLFGSPIKTEHAHHERLPKFLALPVFASDALSSTAYATEEILRVLVLAIPFITIWSQLPSDQLLLLRPISIAIAALLIIVAASYVQTIIAYPTGGGSYIVSSQNLGSGAGRIAGASLLIDYTLTVAVSISAGVAAIISAFPAVAGGNMPTYLALAFVTLITLANLRGVRESGAIFAIPTYSFIFSIFLILGVSFYRFVLMGQTPDPAAAHSVPLEEILHHNAKHVEAVGLFFILRAFASGCTALTGIEAIADGVGAFRKPEAKNAATTMVIMVSILTVMFLGISYMSFYLRILPIPEESHAYKTVVAQIASTALGNGPTFIFVQLATMAVLILAANTAYADFPRISYFMARDGFLPRQLMNVGDRLVYQNGIITLAAVAGLLIIWSHADTHKLIPLYAVGVFISFTLSQLGMVFWQKNHKPKLWGLRASVSAFGALITFVVAIIIFSTKFWAGAWIIGILMIVLQVIFWIIHQHYENQSKSLALPDEVELPKQVNTVLLLVPRVHQGVLHALQYAKSIGLDLRAVHVNIDPEASPKIRAEWEKYGQGVPLVILESTYRSITEPVIEYVDEALREHPDHMVTVIVPEFVPRKWWHLLLHNNLAFQLRRLLGGRKNVVITTVRYFLER